MRVRSLILIICLMVSQVSMSQVALEEEVSFWDQKVIGMHMSELFVTIFAVIFVVLFAYKMSVSPKKKAK